MIKNLCYFFLLMFLFLALFGNGARGDGWEWFQLCRHSTGELVGEMRLDGIKTQGRIYMDTSLVNGIVPLDHENCVIMNYGLRESVTVYGSLVEVWCKIRSGPECRQNEIRDFPE